MVPQCHIRSSPPWRPCQCIYNDDYKYWAQFWFNLLKIWLLLYYSIKIVWLAKTKFLDLTDIYNYPWLDWLAWINQESVKRVKLYDVDILVSDRLLDWPSLSIVHKFLMEMIKKTKKICLKNGCGFMVWSSVIQNKSISNFMLYASTISPIPNNLPFSLSVRWRNIIEWNTAGRVWSL